MKLKEIEEIVEHKVPIWQPALLIILLILGFSIVPLIANQATELKKKTPTKENILGVETIQKTVDSGVEQYVIPYAQKLQQGVESVLGVAQQSATDIASQSAQQAKEYVFDNTVGKVLDSVHSLPTDQQDLIKKAICK